jgi:Xaa-Pro aminopeptidase
MLSLSMAKFLKGTRGCNLDIIARQPLWDHGLDYRHGTGHGVGYFLNVHEGPQGFSQGLNDVPMEVGMMTTIEPGYYVEGSHGIRIENIVVTQKEEETQWGEFYSFEALTLVPIDKKPIVKTLMSEREISYLNSYHQNVYEKLSPFLSESESTWLKAATSPL